MEVVTCERWVPIQRVQALGWWMGVVVGRRSWASNLGQVLGLIGEIMTGTRALEIRESSSLELTKRDCSAREGDFFAVHSEFDMLLASVWNSHRFGNLLLADLKCSVLKNCCIIRLCKTGYNFVNMPSCTDLTFVLLAENMPKGERPSDISQTLTCLLSSYKTVTAVWSLAKPVMLSVAQSWTLPLTWPWELWFLQYNPWKQVAMLLHWIYLHLSES